MDTPDTGVLLRDVARLYSRAQRVVAECCRTTSTQCHLLLELGSAGPIPLSELGQRLCLEKSWVSRAVDRLVVKGLVAKSANPLDARSLVVTLTASGRRKVSELNRTLDDHAGRLLSRLSDCERVAARASLAVLQRALRDDPSAPACTPTERPARQAS